MARTQSYSPLRSMAPDTLGTALGAAVMNADSLKEQYGAMATRSGTPVRGTPSPAGTTRMAGAQLVQPFEQVTMPQSVPQVAGFMKALQSGPFAYGLEDPASGGGGAS